MAHIVGKTAPAVVTKAVVHGKIEEQFTFEQFRGKKVLLFFYPLDFTFVCPTELLAFEKARSEFEARNCKLIGCSVDSCFTHLAWQKTPVAEGGIHGVSYPLIGDVNKQVCEQFGVLVPGEGIAYRALFLIDENGIVRHMLMNDLPLGRSVDEALRMVDSLAFFQKNGEVCPANWKSGEKGMKATLEGLRKYIATEVLQ